MFSTNTSNVLYKFSTIQNYPPRFFSCAMHQGKKLQELVKLKKLNHTEIAVQLGFAGRSSFTRYFKEEILDNDIIDRFSEAINIDRKVFFDSPRAEAASPIDTACLQQLVAAQAKIIELQERLLEMSKPSINAPKVAKLTV